MIIALVRFFIADLFLRQARRKSRAGELTTSPMLDLVILLLLEAILLSPKTPLSYLRSKLLS